jgi:MSHA pilin protein MshD
MPSLVPARRPTHAACRLRAARPAVRARRGERGFTLIELVVFIVVVSAALAGVLSVFIPATTASADPMVRRQALAIAESLLEEVELMPFTYCDPDDANLETATSAGGCASLVQGIGPNAGETRFGPTQFDNVGDYAGYSMSGIVDITNTAVAGLSGYSASVAVAATALGSITAASGDALRITVTVTAPGGSTVVLDGVRTRQAPNAAL